MKCFCYKTSLASERVKASEVVENLASELVKASEVVENLASLGLKPCSTFVMEKCLAFVGKTFQFLEIIVSLYVQM